MGELLQDGGDAGVVLRPLEGGGPVGGVQAGGAGLLFGLEAVGLSRAAHAAVGAGHDLDQVVVGGALVDLLQELLGVDEAVDHRQLDLPVAHGDGGLPDGLVAPQRGVLQGPEGVPGFVGHAVADHRLGHAAGGAVDGARAGAQAEGQVGGLQVQLGQLDARLLDHVDDLLGGEDQVHVGLALVLELGPGGLHLLGGAGHDGDVEGGLSVLGVLLLVVPAHDGGEHLHGGLAGGDVL